jgi:hypothetical protein
MRDQKVYLLSGEEEEMFPVQIWIYPAPAPSVVKEINGRKSSESSFGTERREKIPPEENTHGDTFTELT